jgi:hypothetical protein
VADPALLWIDPFNYPYTDAPLHYNTVDNTNSANAIGTTYGTSGRRGFGASSVINTGWLGKTVFDKTVASFEGRFVILGGLGATDLDQLRFWDSVGAASQISLRLGSDYVFRVYRGSTLLATFTTALVANVFYHVGVKVLIHGSTGTLLTALNGVTQNNLTNINTLNTANAFVSQVRFGCLATGATGSGMRFGWSDVCIQADASTSNVTLLGDCAALALAVTSDATPNDGTTTSGTDHFAMVDDGVSGQDGDTTTLTLATDGDEERFGCENLPGSVTDVKAVCQRVVAKKTDTGTCKLRHRLYVNATTYDSDQSPLSLSYDSYYKGRTLNPDTAAEFTPAEVDALVQGFVRDDA